MVIFEGFSHLGIDDVVFGVLVGVGLDVETCGELARVVGGCASAWGDVEWHLLWQTSLIPTELVNVKFLPDNPRPIIIKKSYASYLLCAI